MRNVIVSLCGGLGNQLFQYATARSLAERLGVSVVLDLSWFKKDHVANGETPRDFALEPFKLQTDLIWHSENYSFLPLRLRQKLYSVHAKLFHLGHVPILRETNGILNEDFFELKRPVWLKGYWQSERYFDNITNRLVREIGQIGNMSQPAKELYLRIVNSDAIAIHVRRGDYITNPKAAEFHGKCEMEYYYDALKIATNSLSAPHCYVFSDDPNWVFSNFEIEIPKTIVKVSGPTQEYQDLWLMAACKNFIIANSSFSWWGAWLSRNNNKIVIAPKHWYRDESQDISNILPSSWYSI